MVHTGRRSRLSVMSGARKKAERLLAARLDVVGTLEQANAALAEAQQRTREAESAVATAVHAATDAGWTPTELRKLGFAASPSRRGGRPKATRRPAGGNEPQPVAS